jgi:heme exporter protein A
VEGDDQKRESPEELAIETAGLTKSFGSRLALRGVDLEVRKGEFLVILGTNGAGKTTLLKILATLLRPTAGKVRVAGFDLTERAKEVRRAIGVVSHQTYLYDDFTAHENLQFYGRMYGVPNLEERAQEVFTRVGLKGRLHDRVGTYSRGMQQRLAIARAMLHDPPVLLLDEPETGLDQQAGVILREMVEAFGEGGRTTVMTTHSLERTLDLADRVVIIAKGKVAHDEATKGMALESLRDAYCTCTGTTL